MSLVLSVPQDYGYVVLSVVGTCFVGVWHGLRIGGFRKAAGIRYPQMMAETSQMSAATPEKKKAMYLYNCAQRAHGNYLENWPATVIYLFISGLTYPRVAAGMGVGWMISRVAYSIGYTRADKDDGSGRLAGTPYVFFQLGLLGLATYTGVQMIR